MSLQSSPKRRRKPLKSNSAARNPLSSHNLQYAVQLTKQAYEEREQTCSYQDYLALITLATFNEHEIAHIQADKFASNAQIEHELLKRWNKLPVEDRNKYENEAIDNDIFHQIAYARVEHDRCTSIRNELETQWNNLPDEERIIHKRVITNRDIERRRLL